MHPFDTRIRFWTMREGGKVYALALELGAVGEGPTVAAAVLSLTESIGALLRYSASSGTPVVRPANPDEEAIFECVRAKRPVPRGLLDDLGHEGVVLSAGALSVSAEAAGTEPEVDVEELAACGV
jgi:hypothetical protein